MPRHKTYYIAEQIIEMKRKLEMQKQTKEEVMTDTQLLNDLAQAMRDKYQDNAVEALVAALSTVVTEDQLRVLLEANK
jgi:hypothetical protein